MQLKDAVKKESLPEKSRQGLEASSHISCPCVWVRIVPIAIPARISVKFFFPFLLFNLNIDCLGGFGGLRIFIFGCFPCSHLSTTTPPPHCSANPSFFWKESRLRTDSSSIFFNHRWDGNPNPVIWLDWEMILQPFLLMERMIS
jgi:hypothetical protein